MNSILPASDVARTGSEHCKGSAPEEPKDVEAGTFFKALKQSIFLVLSDGRHVVHSELWGASPVQKIGRAVRYIDVDVISKPFAELIAAYLISEPTKVHHNHGVFDNGFLWKKLLKIL